MNRLLLHRLDLKRVKLTIKYLAKIHDDRLVNLLPQMRTENLNERDLERWNFAVHEDARQIELHLETDVNLKILEGYDEK